MLHKYISITFSKDTDQGHTSDAVSEHLSALDNAAAFVYIATLFLVPVAFIPAIEFPFQMTKGLVIAVGILLALGLWLIERLRSGEVRLPKGAVIIAAGVIPLVYLIAALFSSSVHTSLLGAGFEIDTFATVLLLTVGMLLGPAVLRKRKYIALGYGAILVSATVIALFQAARLIGGPSVLSLGIFTSGISNLIGGWYDLGAFFGLSALLALTTIELLNVRRNLKLFSYAVLVLSLFFLALINFSLVWYALGLLSLVFLVYTLYSRFSSPDDGGREAFSLTSLGVFVISLIFIITGSTLSGALSGVFDISHISARPSWSSALSVAENTLASNPLLGAGPNRFDVQWLAHKPEGVNQTLFWNTNFDAGVSYLASTPVVVGLIGLLSWIIFLGLYIGAGIHGIFAALRKNIISRYVIISSFLASLYLWGLLIFYVPNIVILFLAFAMTGICLAALLQEQRLPQFRLSFVQNPRAGFVAILAIIILLIGTVSSLYMYSKKYVAAVHFQKGVTQLNQDGNLATAQDRVETALNIDSEDRYYRALAQIHLAQLNRQAANQNTDQSVLQNELGAAIQNAQQATERDESDYQNWMVLGRIYEALVPQQVEGAYERAREAYDRAREENPHNPAILLTQARLEIANGDNETARELIRRALEEKSNYTEAVFMLAQIQVQEGDTEAAIDSTRAAAQLSPNDPTVFFQLGLLEYESQDYQSAIAALERATGLASNYANAKYYLGLSYDRVGNREAAIAEFEDIQETNPNNEEVQRILDNLRAGRGPLVNTDTSEEINEREDLPIEENTQETTE